MNINVKIEAPGLVEALEKLAAALGGMKVTPLQGQPQQQQQQQQQPQQQNSVPTGVPLQNQQAPQPGPQAPNTSTVPTATVSYTQDQLAVAASSLLDSGRSNELVSLLASFGVQALTQLPQEHYGSFATKLRELGAQI
ncbi:MULTISPECIES: hypothetical protein [unclassified Bacillus (in: firmicutes)]|uniref:hypothetical protein n=1 Tax=unclassified Bacillus (in: firmicutes) TaxID=185979 RepID=UPI000D04520D|nr:MULTISPECIES: hypothetical protein [unclassified Bacillus (in: firmicutes)]PRR92933.1 hypothetical protein C6W21_05970 [Bacillus sp. NMCN1]PRR95330.1 hypothetical protein C6W20_18395 [Bacillus sp. NMCN6]